MSAIVLITCCPVQCSHICFRAFLKANAQDKEIIPPALNLTAQQLFWVGYGQDYCLLGDRFEKYETIEEVVEYWVMDIAYCYFNNCN